MVAVLVSFWDGLFSGAMLVSGGVLRGNDGGYVGYACFYFRVVEMTFDIIWLINISKFMLLYRNQVSLGITRSFLWIICHQPGSGFSSDWEVFPRSKKDVTFIGWSTPLPLCHGQNTRTSIWYTQNFIGIKWPCLGDICFILFEPNASHVKISRVKVILSQIDTARGGIFAPCTLDVIKELNDWSFKNT